MSTRLLVIDDDVQLAHVLSMALDRHEFDAVVAPDAVTGLEMAVTTDPDVIILDLGLPDRDGIDVLRELRAWSAVPVLILSGATDRRRRVEALDSGADDYVQKPFSVDELMARVRALLRRSTVGEASAGTRRYGRLEIDLQAQHVTVDGDEVRLTPTEWRLLQVMVAAPGRLLGHQWILDEVWDSAHGEETKVALRAHMRSLRAKIGDKADAPIYIRTESGAGYRWVATDTDAEPDSAPEAAAVATAPSETVRDDQGTAALTHELNNALTALRVAVYLLRRRATAEPSSNGAPAAPGPGDVAELSARVEEIVGRVSALAVELELRVVAQLEG